MQKYIHMKYTYTTMLAAILTIAGTLLFTSCESNEENVPSTVIEKMQFEAHFSHSRDLYEEGSSSLITIRSELGAAAAIHGPSSGNSLVIRLELMLISMDEIEQDTRFLLYQIHSEKEKILSKLEFKNCIGKFDVTEPMPARINGDKLSGDIKDVFHSKSMESDIVAYRDKLIEQVANSHVRRKNGQLQYDSILDPNILQNIPSKSDKCDASQLQNLLSDVNYEDQEGLIELILELTPRTGENKTYSAREALHYLCMLEARILKARKTAFGLFKTRISFCGTSFDKITPVISGPEVVAQGSEVELELMIAALDSYNNPEVTCNENATIEVRDGVAYLKLNVDKTTTLKGTIGIRNKQGALKTENWEKTIVVN
ncbi:MAG: hypothetical protein Crog4KO_22080 [Crocinitomicaceae bacterium]